MKKVVSLVIAVCLIAGLFVGCDSQVANDQKVSTPAATTAGDQKVVIKFASYQTKEQDRVDACKADFQAKNPNITVDITYTPDTQYYTVIKTKFASNDIPDVLTTRADNDTKAMINAGYLMDITDLDVVKKMTPSVVPMVTYNDGKIYQLALGIAGEGMIVNNAVLKDAGVTSIPKNYTEFLTACAAIKAKGIAPIAFAEKDAVSTEMFGGLAIEQFISDQDAKDLVSGAKKPSQIDGIKNAWLRVKELKDKGYFIDNFSGVTYGQGETMVANGQSAFIGGGEWALGDFKKANPNADISFAPIPMSDKPAALPIMFVTGSVSIAKDTKVKDAAVKWLEYNGSTDYASIYKPDYPMPIQGVVSPASKEDQEFTSNYSALFTAEKSGSYGFNNWKEVRVKPLESLLLSNTTIDKVLAMADSLYATK